MALSLTDLTEYLDAQEWKYSINEEQNHVIMRMNMKTVDTCTCLMRVIDDTTLVCYTVFPIKAPEERRLAVAEYLCRANYGLYHGNFEIDMGDGEVRYKTTGMTTEEEHFDEDVIARILNLGFAMVDRYAPGILSVIYANDEPAHAVARIEEARRAAQQQAEAE